MADILPSIGSLILWGAGNVVTKIAISKAGRQKAIAYGYMVTVALLWIGGLLSGMNFSIPDSLLGLYALQVIVGAVAVIAYFKALEKGSSSIIGALGESYVILVIAAGVIVFGEAISLVQLAGSGLVLAAAFI